VTRSTWITAWLLTGIGVYVVTTVFAVALYAPVMGIVALALTMAILYFMIVKPTLWSAG
jgi:hypothetical protein